MRKFRPKRLHSRLRIGWRVPLAFALIAVVAALIVQSVEHGLHERAATAYAPRAH